MLDIASGLFYNGKARFVGAVRPNVCMCTDLTHNSSKGGKQNAYI